MIAQAQRWGRLVRRGVSPLSIIRPKLTRNVGLRFNGVDVRAPDLAVTRDTAWTIWGDGEYEIPGFVPQPGWRVIDIGANVGVYSMLAASRGATVTSYEPHPALFAALQANTAKWGVDCRHAAVVGDANGPLDLFVNRRHTRHSLFNQEIETGQPLHERVQVPAVSIDEALSEPADLLKIDCEGGEFDIFAHAATLRNADRIIAEVHALVGDPQRALGDVRAAGFDAVLHDARPGEPFCLLTAH